MGKWFAGGANRLTLARIPCMALAVYALFTQSRDSLAWYWVGMVAVALGMVLDGLDGFWARRISPPPTKEGQFLDQFVDKWGFVYPLFAAIAICHPVPVFVPLAMAVLLLLDIKSCYGHYRNYLESLREQKLELRYGAVPWGKRKFALQNVFIGVVVASRCPLPAAGDPAWWHWTCHVIVWLDSCLAVIPYVRLTTEHLGHACLGLAILCALLSLRKRRALHQAIAQEREQQAQPSAKVA